MLDTEKKKRKRSKREKLSSTVYSENIWFYIKE